MPRTLRISFRRLTFAGHRILSPEREVGVEILDYRSSELEKPIKNTTEQWSYSVEKPKNLRFAFISSDLRHIQDNLSIFLQKFCEKVLKGLASLVLPIIECSNLSYSAGNSIQI